MLELSELYPQLRNKRLRYALALAVLLLVALPFVLGANPAAAAAFLLLAAAVAGTALAGVWPAVVAVVLASLGFDFFFAPPVATLSLDSASVAAAIGFVLMASGTRIFERWAVASGRDQKLRLVWQRTLRARISGGSRMSPVEELGRLDGYEAGELYGWALDPADEGRASKVTLFVDGRPRAEALAVHYRPDVGSHAFYFDLSAIANPESEVQADVRFADGRLLPNAPLVVRTPPASIAVREQAVLFMHISKTAGTAFREALAENYRQCEIAYLYPDVPGMLCDNLMLLPLEQRRGFRLVAGHFQYGVHNALPQEHFYVTIVREPVARIISEHRYLREKQGDTAASAADSLSAMLQEQQNTNLDNLLVRCFAGIGEKEMPPGAVDKRAFELALANMREKFSFIGHQERFQDAYDRLREKFDWKPRAGFEWVNKTRVGTPQEYEAARSAIEHYNRWDLKLYEEILRLHPMN